MAAGGIVAVTGLPARASTRRRTLEAAAVLVTLVPQGLAIMITVTYAAGSLRVTRLGALVQRRNAVESDEPRRHALCRQDRYADDAAHLVRGRRAAGDLDIRLRATMARARNPARVDLLLGTIARSTAAPYRTTEALATASGRRAVSRR